MKYIQQYVSLKLFQVCENPGLLPWLVGMNVTLTMAKWQEITWWVPGSRIPVPWTRIPDARSLDPDPPDARSLATGQLVLPAGPWPGWPVARGICLPLGQQSTVAWNAAETTTYYDNDIIIIRVIKISLLEIEE